MSEKIQVFRYKAEMQAEWDQFVAESRNGTFLLQRGYMDYHADRFSDHSMVVTNGGRLIAVLPANLVGSALYSHQGLTYGGVVVGQSVTASTMLEVFETMLRELGEQGVKSLSYKTIPRIYHTIPTEEDLYALFRHDAKLYCRNTLSVIDMRNRPAYQERRRRNIKKAQRADVRVGEAGDWAAYWNLLARVLRERFDTNPVHSLDEIQLLRGRFPNNIRLFTASIEGEIAAGVVIYESDRVAHAQYIAASDRGREIGALDMLFSFLLDDTYAQKPYFDFGISNEDDGRYLNVGLMEQKEGFGGRTIVHDCYQISL